MADVESSPAGGDRQHPTLEDINGEFFYLSACLNQEVAADVSATSSRGGSREIHRREFTESATCSKSTSSYGALSHGIYVIFFKNGGRRGFWGLQITYRQFFHELGALLKNMGVEQHPQLSTTHPINLDDPMYLIIC